MRLWHDDVRPAPEGWIWVQNNEEAQAILETGKVKIVSLDHDLGAIAGEDDIYTKGTGEETGLDLVDWMIFNNLVPERVIVHSWNPAGAARMIRTLKAKGYYNVIYTPYSHRDGSGESMRHIMRKEVDDELNDPSTSAKL